jgi:hypothetical protein
MQLMPVQKYELQYHCHREHGALGVHGHSMDATVRHHGPTLHNLTLTHHNPEPYTADLPELVWQRTLRFNQSSCSSWPAQSAPATIFQHDGSKHYSTIGRLTHTEHGSCSSSPSPSPSPSSSTEHGSRNGGEDSVVSRFAGHEGGEGDGRKEGEGLPQYMQGTYSQRRRLALRLRRRHIRLSKLEQEGEGRTTLEQTTRWSNALEGTQTTGSFELFSLPCYEFATSFTTRCTIIILVAWPHF